ncbi:14797_t:CDS:1, partial [Racocetra fulgida]
FKQLKFNPDGTLANCEIPCIWKAKEIKRLTFRDLKSADALFCVNQPGLPKKKARKGQKFIQYTLEPKTHCPECYDKARMFDIHATYDENSELPT